MGRGVLGRHAYTLANWIVVAVFAVVTGLACAAAAIIEELPTYGALVMGASFTGVGLCALGVAAMRPYDVQSYGKAGLVGVAGEQEHAVAMLTTVFGDAIRRAVGGGKAWISSLTKRVASGATIDVPLAHKDALYVRSHYDGVTIAIPDGPLPDEIAIIAVFANRGRLNHRVGGLSASAISGVDGLV